MNISRNFLRHMRMTVDGNVRLGGELCDVDAMRGFDDPESRLF